MELNRSGQSPPGARATPARPPWGQGGLEVRVASSKAAAGGLAQVPKRIRWARLMPERGPGPLRTHSAGALVRMP